MKNYLLVLFMIVVAKATSEAYLTDEIGVSQADQEKYVRDLAKYFFKKSMWKQVFDESECPEFDEPRFEEHCIHPDDAPIAPLPPITICKFDPNHEGCPENPDEDPVCTKDNLELCRPPVACDLEQFKNKDECLAPE